MTTLATNNRSLFPAIDGDLVRAILLAGIAADVTWEVWARGITPFLVGGPLEPAGLIQSVFGFNNLLVAELLHAIVGVIFYPIGYLFIARPLQRMILRPAAGADRHRFRHRSLGICALRDGASDRRLSRFPRLHPADLGIPRRTYSVRPGGCLCHPSPQALRPVGAALQRG